MNHYLFPELWGPVISYPPHPTTRKVGRKSNTTKLALSEGQFCYSPPPNLVGSSSSSLDLQYTFFEGRGGGRGARIQSIRKLTDKTNQQLTLQKAVSILSVLITHLCNPLEKIKSTCYKWICTTNSLSIN